MGGIDGHGRAEGVGVHPGGGAASGTVPIGFAAYLIQGVTNVYCNG